MVADDDPANLELFRIVSFDPGLLERERSRSVISRRCDINGKGKAPPLREKTSAAYGVSWRFCC